MDIPPFLDCLLLSGLPPAAVLIFCLGLSRQVAHVPAAAHRGPDHLPAGLSGTGQAVSLAAHHVSIMYTSKIRAVYPDNHSIFLHLNLFHFYV